MKYIQKLLQLLDKRTKCHLLWLMAFSIFVSLIEAIGISAIMPFIDISTNFEVIQINQYYQWVFNFFNFEREVDFVISFGFVLLGFYLFRGGVNILHDYMSISFSRNLSAHISKELFKTYLLMPYQIFSNKNSSFLTKTVLHESNHISFIVKGVLFMISEIFVVLLIYILMLITSWKITLVFTGIFLVKVLVLSQTVTKKIKSVGVTREIVAVKFFEILNKTFSNFKYVKLQSQNRINKLKAELDYIADEGARVGVWHETLERVPKIFLETMGFGMVVALLMFLLYKQQSNVLYILPTLSLFVLALYRLLPSVNRIISGYNTMMYYHKSIDVIDLELKTNQEKLANEAIVFNHKIELKNINFSYKDKAILDDITLTIDKGEKVAFIGESGSGKSTLVDLIIGLYHPNEGNIKIDNVVLNEFNLQSWRSQIGYIPQQVYLFDGTIVDNICFGRKLDQTLLEIVLQQANILDFLKTKQGVDTLVGEGGVQLSGGQKQRVAIARALYGQPEILVLDEATSALDDETEQKIMNEIYKVSEGKTLIIVAHRLSTIKSCNKVYKITDGVVK